MKDTFSYLSKIEYPSQKYPFLSLQQGLTMVKPSQIVIFKFSEPEPKKIRKRSLRNILKVLVILILKVLMRKSIQHGRNILACLKNWVRPGIVYLRLLLKTYKKQENCFRHGRRGKEQN